jgi:hypothetical protein
MATLFPGLAAASVNANCLAGRLLNDGPVVYSHIPRVQNNLKTRKRHRQMISFAKGSSLQGMPMFNVEFLLLLLEASDKLCCFVSS